MKTCKKTALDKEGEALTSQLKNMSVEETDTVGRKKVPDRLQCCICQENCVHPVELPCAHVFCYLCIKGVAARNNRCALCRQHIPVGFMNHPSVVDQGELKSKLEQNSCNWFYEAKNGGWWMYEQRISSELEKACSEQKDNIRVQISGFFYVIDLKAMVQYREDMSTRRRRIRKGDMSTEQVKGVAGIVVKTADGTDDKEDTDKK